MTKKGFVYTWRDATAATKINSMNPDWYYTWSLSQIHDVNVPFVPMIWSSKSLAQLPGVKGDVVLGFNEPDRTDQSNTDVPTAVKYWPQFKATGKRLGSPATAGNPTKGWQRDFMISCSADVDFMCVHWYGSANPHTLLSLLHDLYDQYKKPIWITEFAVADWSATTQSKYSESQVIDFMEAVLPALDDLPYVERYCWKTRTTSDVNMGTSALFNDDGTLTRLGKVYSMHGIMQDDVPVARFAALIEESLNKTNESESDETDSLHE